VRQTEENSIRAVVKYFREEHQLGLDMQLRPMDESLVRGRAEFPVSFLMTDHEAEGTFPNGRVNATVWIQPDASRQLARFAVAHEIYHLLLQAKFCSSGGVVSWEPPNTRTKLEEDECNAFAWQLCFLHNKFYTNKQKIEGCLFGDMEAFETVISTDLSKSGNWPKKFTLNGSDPWWTAP